MMEVEISEGLKLTFSLYEDGDIGLYRTVEGPNVPLVLVSPGKLAFPELEQEAFQTLLGPEEAAATFGEAQYWALKKCDSSR